MRVCINLCALRAQSPTLGGDPKTLGRLPKRPHGTPGHGVPWPLFFVARVASVRGLGGDPKTLGWLPKRPRGTPGHGVPLLLVANLYCLSYLVRLILSVLSSLSYRLCLALSVSSSPSYRRCPSCRRLSYQGGDPKTLG